MAEPGLASLPSSLRSQVLLTIFACTLLLAPSMPSLGAGVLDGSNILYLISSPGADDRSFEDKYM